MADLKFISSPRCPRCVEQASVRRRVAPPGPPPPGEPPGAGMGGSLLLGLGVGALLPPLRVHLQLRQLVHRHRQQPRGLRRQLRLQLRGSPSLRLQILPPPHRPLLQRPPHHRLHRSAPWPAAGPAFPGAQRQLPPRRQLRRRGLHHSRRRLLPRRLQSWLQVPAQHQPGRAAGVVRVAQAQALPHEQRSLFFVGEFGVNDYHFSFMSKSMQQIKSIVPDVVRTISLAIERLIKHGATSFIVPGTIPSGCVPQILNFFRKDDPKEYNSTTGCLEGYNKLGMHHNVLLQKALKKLQSRYYPRVTIVYADLFGPIMEMVESPRKFGFEKDVLTMCCGGPGALICGDDGANVCKKPAARLFWDDVHLTEKAYSYIAQSWMHSIETPARQSSL